MGKQFLTERLLLGAALAAFIAHPALAHAASNASAPAETHAPANAASVAIDSTAAKPDRSHFLCRVRAEARPA